MKYPIEFHEFLQIAKECNERYIGHGNPNAKILIIANEPAADKNTDFGRDLIKYDLDGNLEQWNTNLNIDKLDQDSLEEWLDDAHYGDWNKFNPLWPFKGQRYCQYRFKKGSDNEFNSAKRPTSRTWKQYQKFVDMIYHPKHECNRKQNDPIDFFRHAFIMDFSSEYGKTSKEIDSKRREDSISARLPLFKSAFISHFPVIIVAAGHYIKDIKALNDLRKVFLGFEDVVVEFAKDEHGWRNIHKSKDGKRILIHCKHFSSSVKDPYLKCIAELCAPFIFKD